MSIDEQELRAIAFLASRVRRATPGASPWDDHGLAANLAKLKNRNLHMTVEHVLRHAADPKAKSPGVILGSFTPDAPTTAGPPTPPKRDETCRVPGHDGYRADNCAGCHADQLAGDPLPARTPPAAPEAVEQALAAARAAIVRPNINQEADA